MGATLRDVARSAGVSVTTASRALNGYADVNTKTRARVIEAARRLAYHRDRAARTLVGAPSATVGLVHIDRTGEGLLHPFAGDVIAGIYRGLRLAERDLLVFGPDAVRPDRDLLALCASHHVEGAICLGLDLRDDNLERFTSGRTPIVLLDLPVESARCSYVTSEQGPGAAAAVQHLLALGHRRIAHAAGRREAWVSRERARAWRTTLAAAGVAAGSELIVHTDFTRGGGRDAAFTLLKSRVPPTAIFAASDEVALGVIDAAHECGLRVPQDLSVIGFDDIPELAGEQLTTVRQRRYEMGLSAARLLLALIRGEAVRPVVLPAELIIRRSTGPPARAAPAVGASAAE